jgi:adenylate cyclase
MPVDGKLIPTGGGDDIPLVRDHLTIGRRETCDICLRFPNVSGRHAELTYQDGYWTVRDLGSTNGIKVNGEIVRNKNLSPGDEITIASRTYTIDYTLQGGQSALNELMEDDVIGMDIPLLEKAGLVKPKGPSRERRQHQRH